MLVATILDAQGSGGVRQSGGIDRVEQPEGFLSSRTIGLAYRVEELLSFGASSERLRERPGMERKKYWLRSRGGARD